MSLKRKLTYIIETSDLPLFKMHAEKVGAKVLDFDQREKGVCGVKVSLDDEQRDELRERLHDAHIGRLGRP